MPSHRSITFRAALAVTLAVSLTGCARRSDLVQRTIQLSGPEAVDCGDVRLEDDATAALACVKRELLTGRPFRVVLDVHGIDSRIAQALVRSPSGQLVQLRFDSDRMGGQVFFPYPAMWESECKTISLDDREGRGLQTFSCDQPAV